MADPTQTEHIARPRNPWILFRTDMLKQLQPTQGTPQAQADFSKDIAKMWHQAPASLKRYYEEKARLEKEEHARKYPNYKYRPKSKEEKLREREAKKAERERKKEEMKRSKARAQDIQQASALGMQFPYNVLSALANQQAIPAAQPAQLSPVQQPVEEVPGDAPSPPLSLASPESDSSSPPSSSNISSTPALPLPSLPPLRSTSSTRRQASRSASTSSQSSPSSSTLPFAPPFPESQPPLRVASSSRRRQSQRVASNSSNAEQVAPTSAIPPPEPEWRLPDYLLQPVQDLSVPYTMDHHVQESGNGAEIVGATDADNSLGVDPSATFPTHAWSMAPGDQLANVPNIEIPLPPHYDSFWNGISDQNEDPLSAFLIGDGSTTMFDVTSQIPSGNTGVPSDITLDGQRLPSFLDIPNAPVPQGSEEEFNFDEILNQILKGSDTGAMFPSASGSQPVVQPDTDFDEFLNFDNTTVGTQPDATAPEPTVSNQDQEQAAYAPSEMAYTHINPAALHQPQPQHPQPAFVANPQQLAASYEYHSYGPQPASNGSSSFSRQASASASTSQVPEAASSSSSSYAPQASTSYTAESSNASTSSYRPPRGAGNVSTRRVGGSWRPSAAMLPVHEETTPPPLPPPAFSYQPMAWGVSPSQ